MKGRFLKLNAICRCHSSVSSFCSVANRFLRNHFDQEPDTITGFGYIIVLAVLLKSRVWIDEGSTKSENNGLG